ncbi:murein biosynthesis integral membrane protein MurJ [Clostridium paraputrificum]|uniref:murein biosynthesis integral membrane protein MurJ n=1 Tax=Clostridium paraputrificum TaxID=29363 RepID=UPI003D34BF91
MKKGSLIKSTVIVMFMAIISRFIGFIRDVIIANNFGASTYTDAYKAAATIPETIFMIVGLAISTAFLPMLSKVRVEKGTKEMHKFANNIINILFIISIAIFTIASFFPEQIVWAIAGGFNSETMELATNLTRIVLINLVFLSVNACFTALLQVHEDFVIPSILGLFFNLPIIIYLLVFKNCDIYGLTIANVIGNFLRVVVQVPSLRKHGYRYKLFINLKDERVKGIVILILPVLIGAGANSLNLIVDKRIASGLVEGAMTTLDNAQLLITFINTIVTTSISTVIYPVLANRRNEGNNREFREVLSKAVIYLGILLIPITAGMLIYGGDIVRLVYMRGEYTEYAAQLATLALLGYTFGIFFTGVRDILNSTLFSMGQTKITATNGVVGVIINIVLSIVFSRFFGIAGIAVASSIAMVVTALLLFRSIIKLEGQIDIKLLLLKLVRIIIATLVMVLVVLLVNIISINLPVIASLAIGSIIGGVVYFISVYKLKVEEVMEVMTFILKKIRP